ncbi:pilus assembly protein Flp/PilA [Sinomonas atrocyanea]|uniref:Flp family type IVb pilin n=1 Tax=Sinomonas atrocyanea TaxID=37927 RepID=UPI00278605FA|nr:Flp family type IVb pilin [Sinomonas atrocyanea]MDQ0258736.1 pilus assembly protein Flp/PilA [Sinomonas atrocyanea]
MLSIVATLHTLGLKLKERALSGEKGATAVEYGIMVALIAVAIITVVGLLGGQLNTIFTDVKNSLVPAA